MFVELNSLINVSEKDPPKRKFILLSDSQNDGSFIIHHFLALYIKGGFRVFFVALVQSFSHYNNVAQKLGVNLRSACENGKVTYIDGLKLLAKALADGDEEDSLEQSTADSCSGDNNPFANLRNASFTLQPLYNRIKSTFENEREPCLLVIDDLSCLLSIGIHVQNVIDFAHYCYSLMCCSTTMLNGCFVTLVHNDSDVEDEESLLLWKQLCYYSHMELHVRGLSSGYCKDVHGQLTITQRDQHRTKHNTRNLQFKILEKNVTFFAPGMSKAVL